MFAKCLYALFYTNIKKDADINDLPTLMDDNNKMSQEEIFMEKKNLQIIGNIAFYDSVKFNEPLVNREQAQKWFESVSREGISELFILTTNNNYYKKNKNKLSLISEKIFNEEFKSITEPQITIQSAINNVSISEPLKNKASIILGNKTISDCVTTIPETDRDEDFTGKNLKIKDRRLPVDDAKDDIAIAKSDTQPDMILINKSEMKELIIETLKEMIK